MVQSPSFTLSCKRSTSHSPTSVPVKRLKSESFSIKCAPCTLPLTATHGVEEIKYPLGVRVSNLTQADIENLIQEKEQFLSAQRRRVTGLPLVFDDGIVLHWVYDSDANLSQIAGPADDSDSDIEIVSFKLATDNVAVEKVHTNEISGVLGRPRSQSPSSSSAAVQDNETLPDDVAGLLGSITVPPVNRETAMQYLSGNWSSILNSEDDMTPDSDDNRPCQPTGINEAAEEATSSRSEVRTTPARRFSTLQGEEPARQCNQSQATTSNSTECNGMSSRPRGRSNYPTPDYDTTTDDGSESDVSLQPQRPIALSSISSTSGSNQDNPLSMSNKRVPLPKTPYGRSRRLLIPTSGNLPLAAITMRADVQFVDRRKQYRLTLNSLPNPGVYRHVEDACIVGDTIILGYNNGPSQITFVPVTTDAPCRVDARASPHVNSPRIPKSSGQGVRCLAPMRAESGSVEFFTGGHDRRIFKWAADTQYLEEPTIAKLNVFLDSSVSAMAYRHHNNSLVSTDTKKLYVTDLTRCYTPKPKRVSNDVHQIHVHPQTPNMMLLEVRHLDQQVLVFDQRKGGFDRPPCCTFGYRCAVPKFEPTYTRGSAHHAFFARGHQDGTVLLWDFRNVKNIVAKSRSQLAEAVVHTVISDGHAITYGGGVVTFLNDFLYS